MTTTSNFAIYNRPGRKYIVKRFDPALPDLWAQLGSNYNREMAQKLADSLTRDERSNREETKKRTRTTIHEVSAETIEAVRAIDGEDVTPEDIGESEPAHE